MNRQELLAFAEEQYGTQAEYPWNDQNVVLRHKENRKWYAALLKVGRDKLGLAGDGTVDVLNVKCDPIMVGILRVQNGFHPAYHMNKEKWISIRLDGSAPDEEIKNLLAQSYALTGPKKSKKKRTCPQ